MKRKPTDISSLDALALIPYITLTHRGKKWRFSIPEELEILRKEDTDIHQAERYAFWRKMLEVHLDKLRKAERDYKETLDEMTLKVPETFAAVGRKCPEYQVRATVRLQRVVREAAIRLERLQNKEGLCRLMCEAFEHRRSALMKMKARNNGES